MLQLWLGQQVNLNFQPVVWKFVASNTQTCDEMFNELLIRKFFFAKHAP